MTEHVREWLPPEAFTKDIVRPALSTLLAEWSRRWFVRERVEITDVHVGVERAGQALIVESGLAEIELSGRGKRNLLEALLGLELGGSAVSEGDHKLLDAFALDAIADLMTGIDDMVVGKGPDGTLLTISLTLDGREMASLILPDHALIPAMKAAMARRRPTADAPHGCLHAIKPVELTVEAVLGSAGLALGDLQHLSVGDVIVLEKAVTEPVELRLSGSGRFVGHGRLGRDGAHAFIRFQ